MTTSEVVTQQALALASAGSGGEEAVRELLTVSRERRVAVVRARQSLLARTDDPTADPTTVQAVELLDAVLTRLPV